MKFPSIGNQPMYKVSVPELSGGVNLKDAPNMVEDSQLTACENMWWKDSALRTRPGVHTDADGIWDIGGSDMTPYFDYDFYPAVTVYEGGGKYTYIPYFYQNEGSRASAYFGMSCFSEDGKRIGGCGVGFDPGFDGTDPYATAALVFTADRTEDGNGIYVLFNNGQIYRMKIVSGVRRLELVPQTDIYAPVVVINALGGTEETKKNGVFFEGFNLLTGAFWSYFTTDGAASQFKLPVESLTCNTGENTVIEYTAQGGGVVKWEITAPMQSVAADVNGAAVYADINYTQGKVSFRTSTGEAYKLPAAGISSNLHIKAWKTDPDAAKKISHMKFCTWYGGDRSGLNGGTRLFVSGNPEHPNLVHWSDTNNPFYFSENNYAYIGNSTQSITGFGRQSDILVIFKENETYYANYEAGTYYTAQDVIDGKIVDVSVYSAKFPITPVSSGIGCDCPGTIQLCNNRLVWAASDGHVYGLMAANQNSERNIRELSGMVRSRLLSHTAEEWRNAVSGDYDGRYLLFVGNDAYVLDYMDSGFQYYASYYDDRKAQRGMPWHIWHLNNGAIWQATAQLGNDLLLFGSVRVLNTDHPSGEEYRLFGAAFRLEGDSDSRLVTGTSPFSCMASDTPIHSCFRTKSYDFKRPEALKNIYQVYLGAEQTEEPITFTYITDKYTQQDVSTLSAGGMCRKTPNAMRVRQFALQADCDSPIAVSSIVINYKSLGGVR